MNETSLTARSVALATGRHIEVVRSLRRRGATLEQIANRPKRPGLQLIPHAKRRGRKGQFSEQGNLAAYARAVGRTDRTLRKWARDLGSLRAAVLHFGGKWTDD